MDSPNCSWPKRKVEIKDYGWEIEFYEMSVDEQKAIARLTNRQIEAAKKKSWAEVEKTDKEILDSYAKLVITWNITDRTGKSLPVEGPSFSKVPITVLSTLAEAMTGALLNPKAQASTLG